LLIASLSWLSFSFVSAHQRRENYQAAEESPTLVEDAIGKLLISCDLFWYLDCHFRGRRNRAKMFRLSQFSKLAACTSFLALIVAAGCSQPASVQGAAQAQTNEPQVPFTNGESASHANSSQEASDETQNDAANPASIPFRDPNSLPTGTLLTVRLDKPISADGPDANGTFDAIVDEPVVVNGITLVPRGAKAAGRVESARASTLKSNRGYVRLALASIDLGDRDLAVQTSSLFARGSFSPTPNAQNLNSGNFIHLDKGRRLTFRLAGPVYVAGERSISSR
jgi:hypothetical protein